MNRENQVRWRSIPKLMGLGLLGAIAWNSDFAIAQDLDLDRFLELPSPTQNDPQRTEADRLVRLGGQAERQGLYDKAIAYWLAAAEIYDRQVDLRALGLVYDYLGVTYARLEQFDPAENYLRRRLAIARDRSDFRGQVYGLNNLGSILVQRMNYADAETAFVEALEIARSIESDAGQGLSLSNLGLVAAQRRDYFEAIKRYETALVFRRRVDDSLGEINTRNNLGDAYLALRDYDKAIAAYGYARQLAREAGDDASQLRSLENLTNAYIQAENFPVALRYADFWMVLARDLEDLESELKALRLVGQVYVQMGKLDLARDAFSGALAIALLLENDLEETFLRAELAQVLYLLQGS
ncbi:MAG: tetratricopeptide repeat protein [Jaaginema sp. PMC 1078.18]|nr:tetratricopeptide repeat protein [Jaaginema sp. PMC 1078.18]